MSATGTPSTVLRLYEHFERGDKIEACPRCLGRGYITLGEPPHSFCHTRCPHCDGLGALRKKKEES